MKAYFKNGELIRACYNSQDPSGSRHLQKLQEKYPEDEITMHEIDQEKAKINDISLQNGKIKYTKKQSAKDKEAKGKKKSDIKEKFKSKSASLDEIQEYLSLL